VPANAPVHRALRPLPHLTPLLSPDCVSLPYSETHPPRFPSAIAVVLDPPPPRRSTASQLSPGLNMEACWHLEAPREHLIPGEPAGRRQSDFSPSPGNSAVRLLAGKSIISSDTLALFFFPKRLRNAAPSSSSPVAQGPVFCAAMHHHHRARR
jgi:hypothetical protein